MKKKVIFSLLVLLAIAFTLTPNPCPSAVPSLINYQGVLKDSLGVPQNGSFPMKFSIYDDSTGGNKLWEEIHMAVEVKNGLFNVLLGSSSDKGPIPDSVFSSPNTWLEVQVFGSVLTPRRRIVSVGYALHSEFTDTAQYARFAPDLDWQIDTSGFNVFRITGNVGIGTFPQYKLDVAGIAQMTGFKMPTGASTGRVLTSDATGVATWQPLSLKVYDSGWFSISAGTTYTKTHNLGTTKVIAVGYLAENSDGSGKCTQFSNTHEFDAPADLHCGTWINEITSTTITIFSSNRLTQVMKQGEGWWAPTSAYARIIMLALE